MGLHAPIYWVAMQIPRYWAQVRLRHDAGLRHGATVQRWGWSSDTQDAAEAHARERAQAALDDLLAAPEQRHLDSRFRRMERLNDYGISGETPIREEILAERGDTVMTRNSYGAHCLNTPSVAIADIDTAPEHRRGAATFPALSLGFTVLPLLVLLLQPKALSAQYLLSWLWIVVFALVFARNLRRWLVARSNQQPPEDAERAALERVTAFSLQHPHWGLRLYKTPKGLRVLVTHQPLAPHAAEVQQLFSALQVDPLYARLCQQQQCFRARVTAKPWRIGISGASPQVRRWPVAPGYQAQRDAWCSHYDNMAADYSACHFIDQLGNAHIDAAIQPLLDWHDAASRAHDTQRKVA